MQRICITIHDSRLYMYMIVHVHIHAHVHVHVQVHVHDCTCTCTCTCTYMTVHVHDTHMYMYMYTYNDGIYCLINLVVNTCTVSLYSLSDDWFSHGPWHEALSHNGICQGLQQTLL